MAQPWGQQIHDASHTTAVRALKELHLTRVLLHVGKEHTKLVERGTTKRGDPFYVKDVTIEPGAVAKLGHVFAAELIAAGSAEVPK